MVEPRHPWPTPPTLEGHTRFELTALTQQDKQANMELFFCHGLEAGTTAYKIMTAAMNGRVQDMQSALSRMDALPDFENANGISPLMVAAARGHTQAADMLASHPLVNLNRQSKDGWTALHYATWTGRADVIDMLLTHLADPAIKNSAHKTAYDLACLQNCAPAFENNRAFQRAMKSIVTAQPSVASNPSAQQEEIQKDSPAEPEESTAPKQALERASQLIAIAWGAKSGTTESLKELCSALVVCDDKDFQALFKAIEAARETALTPIPEFFWDAVFIHAAQSENITAMRHIHSNVILRGDTCALALNHVIAQKTKDMPNVVHHLLAWGAKVRPMHLHAAIRNVQKGALEEMVLWSDATADKNTLSMMHILVQGHAVKRLFYGRNVKKKATQQEDVAFFQTMEDFASILKLAKEKNALRAARGGKLRRVFAEAVQCADITPLSAAYAEGCTDRFFRGEVDMGKDAGNTAIAIALLHDKFNLAVRLASDGFDIKKADPARMTALRCSGSEQARTLAKKLENGQIDLTPITELHPPIPRVYYPTFTGRGGF